MLSLDEALSQLLALAEPVADNEEVDTIEAANVKAAVDDVVGRQLAAFKADEAFIKAMIHYEADVDLFSVEEARQS